MNPKQINDVLDRHEEYLLAPENKDLADLIDSFIKRLRANALIREGVQTRSPYVSTNIAGRGGVLRNG